MEYGLVEIKRNEIVTDSLKISKELGIKHADLLRTFELLFKRNTDLEKSISHASDFYKGKISGAIYYKHDFINSQQKKFKGYYLNEAAFLLLVMQLGRYEKAMFIQNLFVKDFQEMKKIIQQHDNTSWLAERALGKVARLEETDQIKLFVEYARGQGSNHAEYYYKHYTNATYKALELLGMSHPIRDILDSLGLSFIKMAEYKVTDDIKNGMENGLHYKEIFLLAKQGLENFAKIMPKFRTNLLIQ